MAKNKKVYTFTRSELNKFVKDVSRKNMSVYLAACIEEFNWQKEDIENMFSRLQRYMDAVNDNLIKLSDIERLVGEELGWDIFDKIY